MPKLEILHRSKGWVYSFLNACIVGTVTKNTINPSRGRFLEVLGGIEGVLLKYKILSLYFVKCIFSPFGGQYNRNHILTSKGPWPFFCQKTLKTAISAAFTQ